MSTHLRATSFSRACCVVSAASLCFSALAKRFSSTSCKQTPLLSCRASAADGRQMQSLPITCHVQQPGQQHLHCTHLPLITECRLRAAHLLHAFSVLCMYWPLSQLQLPCTATRCSPSCHTVPSAATPASSSLLAFLAAPAVESSFTQ